MFSVGDGVRGAYIRSCNVLYTLANVGPTALRLRRSLSYFLSCKGIIYTSKLYR